MLNEPSVIETRNTYKVTMSKHESLILEVCVLPRLVPKSRAGLFLSPD